MGGNVSRFVVVGGVLALAALSVDEVRSSRWQAQHLAALGREMHFAVAPGPSEAIRFPGPGPYDERLGYRQLPALVERLKQQGFAVSAQARMSPRMIELADEGLFPPYREKSQAGLDLEDCRARSLYRALHPERVYDRFESVPPLLVQSLLFIENRELLDAEYGTRNPAVEWDRFGRAVFDQALRHVDPGRATPGGSTLATQIEKYRHSPEGRTDSGREKLRQMASASVRAYLDGEDTLPRRRQIVLDYLNTVPLSAKAGYGEVNGLGDGLWVWYGRDFDAVNRLLAGGITETEYDPRPQRRALAFRQGWLSEQARAYKQALSLMIAQRRPSYYLAEGGEAALAELTDSHLRVMADAGVIPYALRDAALPLALKRRPPAQPERVASFVDRKASTVLRTRLQALLGVPRSYDLDRFDLVARSTMDGEVQHAATRLLRSLREPQGARDAGLYGFRLLGEADDTSRITVSFTLYERGENANLLRVQTDNVDQPFDLNDGARLDLGSTSKLRTLVTYLELVARLHEKWHALDARSLAALPVHRNDVLAAWARDHLRQAADRGLQAMLDAAMLRSYSANPDEGFFTGGGLHRFENFDPEDDGRTMTLREALTRSVNLVFVRLMRDIVMHVAAQDPAARSALQADAGAPERREYLARFADREGSEFTTRFFRRHQGRSESEAVELLLQDRPATPARLAAVFFEFEPHGDEQALAAFLRRHLGSLPLADAALHALHERHRPDRTSRAERAHVIAVHPLELWVAGALHRRPQASLGEVLASGRRERQEVYEWLLRTPQREAQDSRIRNLIEQDAFVEIHRMWRRLGYPFDALTPSYASALGASGDRPAALAELMGILVNRGMRMPTRRIASLRFAPGTPYETRLDPRHAAGERVMPAEVADTVRAAAVGVVEEGTAKRLQGVFRRRDGGVVPVGGKTGTGDHRFEVHGPGGQVVSSRVVNRTATLAFFVGDRYFGTMMAYVGEPYAADYKFTSALPTQLLKALSPVLLPLLEDEGSCSAWAAQAAAAARESPALAAGRRQDTPDAR
jgi:membrane peptidoglycan carboxypeptidase